MLIQLVAVAAAAIWAFTMTVVVLKIVDKVMGLRVSPEDEELGLDVTQHGETAYQLQFD